MSGNVSPDRLPVPIFSLSSPTPHLFILLYLTRWAWCFSPPTHPVPAIAQVRSAAVKSASTLRLAQHLQCLMIYLVLYDCLYRIGAVTGKVATTPASL